MIRFEKLSLRILPATRAKIEISFKDLNSFGNKIDFIDKPTEFEVAARACVEGEQYTADLQCIPCPVSFYSHVEQT